MSIEVPSASVPMIPAESRCTGSASLSAAPLAFRAGGIVQALAGARTANF